MKIITGKTNTQHIDSSDDGERNAALVGSGDYVLDAGRKLGYNLVNSNTIDILDGELMMHGRHGRIADGRKDTVTIENGAQGVKRNDLIVCEYAKRSGIESMELKVVKGAPSDSPSDPAIISGSIRKGTALYQMPLYRVCLDGLTIVRVEKLFKEIPSMCGVLENLADFIYPVGSIYLSVNKVNPGTFLGGTWIQFAAGRTLVGVNGSDSDFNAPEKTGGEKAHTLSVDEMPNHAHSIQMHAHTISSHTHTLGSHSHSIPALSGTADLAGSHKHVVPHSADASTSGKGARMSGYDSGGGTSAEYADRYTGTSSAHTHSVKINAATTGANNGNTGASAQSSTGQTGGNTNNTGGGTAHNNMPPYITCYMWQRTA